MSKTSKDFKQFPYVAGFESTVETVNNTSCTVSGAIPGWLQGVLYRVGPGKFEVEITKNDTNDTDETQNKTDDISVFSFDHRLDGLCLLSRYEIGAGKVWYRSRFMAPKLEQMISSGEKPPILFMQNEDPSNTIIDKMSFVFKQVFGIDSKEDAEKYLEKSSNVNASISKNFPRLDLSTGKFTTSDHVLKTDRNTLLAFDKETLEMKRIFKYTEYDESLKGFITAAHDEYCPISKKAYNIIAPISPARNGFSVVEINRDGQSRRSDIYIDHPNSYLHSMSSTFKYLIVIAQPLYLKFNGLKMMWNKSFMDGFEWNPSKPSYFYVINREDLKLVASYSSDQPFFFLHTVNAFEKESDIFVDIVTYSSPVIMENMKMNSLRNADYNQNRILAGKLQRFQLKDINKQESPKKPVKINSPEDLYENPIDMPRYNDFRIKKRMYKYNKDYRYVYAPCIYPNIKSIYFNTLVKIDLKQKKHSCYAPGNGMTPSEAIFVPEPNAIDEDAGVLLTVLLDGSQRKSYLVILDAREMVEIARAELPQVIPFDNHGIFDYRA